MRPGRVLVAAVALVALTVACGNSDKKATSTSTPASSTTAGQASSTSGPATTAASAGGSTTPVSVAATHPAAHLVAVRAARQETVDRVVFEFSERVPGYNVAYAKKPIRGTSGKEVPLAGSAALVVRMEAASGFDQDAGKPTYSGPSRLQPAGTRAVTDVAQVEDFEAVLSWAIGLQSETPFRVSTLDSPPRLVIDLPS